MTSDDDTLAASMKLHFLPVREVDRDRVHAYHSSRCLLLVVVFYFSISSELLRQIFLPSSTADRRNPVTTWRVPPMGAPLGSSLLEIPHNGNTEPCPIFLK